MQMQVSKLNSISVCGFNIKSQTYTHTTIRFRIFFFFQIVGRFHLLPKNPHRPKTFTQDEWLCPRGVSILNLPHCSVNSEEDKEGRHKDILYVLHMLSHFSIFSDENTEKEDPITYQNIW